MASKKRALIVAAVFIATLFALGIYGVPDLIKVLAFKKVSTVCPRCKIEIQNVDYNVFTGNFKVSDFIFRYERKGVSEVDWIMKTLTGKLSFFELLKGNLIFRGLVVDSVSVKYFDGDTREPKEKSEALDVIFAIYDLDIQQGAFTYLRKMQKSVAELNIPKIQAKVYDLGNSPDLLSKAARAKATGRIEQTGEIAMALEAFVFEKPLRVNIDIEVKDKNLADLTPYFKENIGMSFEGTLIDGSGNVRLIDSQVKTSVYSKFKDFKLTFNKTYERSALVSFFMNIGENILFEEKNTERNKAAQSKTIEAKREKEESIVGFILRSLRLAAVKVAKG